MTRFTAPAHPPLALEPGEREIAAAALADGEARLVATTHRIVVCRVGDTAAREWVDVAAAALDADARELAVTWVDGAGRDVFRFADTSPKKLVRAVNEQVTRSVVTAENTRVPGGQVRVAIRRRANGELFSQVVAVGAVDLADPETARRVDSLEATLREAAGLRG